MPLTDRPLPPAPAALVRPLRRLLRPLVRLLMQCGVTYPVFADLVRTLYVEVAADDLLRDPAARTDSRISLLTGVHRKEIRRLRLRGSPPDETPPIVTLNSQIIAQWLGTKVYADANGDPLALPRTSLVAGDASFESLVASVTSDVRARAVLDDLLSHGVVTIGADDHVRLAIAAYVPRQGGEELLFYFARNLHDHIAAAAANIVAAGPAPFFDRSLHYDRLTPATAARLEAAGRAAAQQLLVDLNQSALQWTDADDQLAAPPDSPAITRRVNVGVYLYVEDEPAGGPQ